MGWGILVKGEMYISRVRKEEIEIKIEDITAYLEKLQLKMFSLMASYPVEVSCEGDPNTKIPWHEYIIYKYKDLCEEFGDTYRELFRLEFALENKDGIEEDE